MRVLMFLFFASMTFSCATSLPPADPSTNPMERADAIWIHTDREAENAYRTIAQTLQDKGFGIASSDNTLLTIRTEPRQLDASFYESLSGAVTVTFNISIREHNGDSVIKMTGLYNSGGSIPTSDSKIEMRGARGSVALQAWNAMQETAEAYPYTRLEYSRNI